MLQYKRLGREKKTGRGGRECEQRLSKRNVTNVNALIIRTMIKLAVNFNALNMILSLGEI